MRQKRPSRTLGPGHDEFWAWCAKGELRVQKCEGCGKLLWPVLKACDACGGGAMHFERMSGRAKVVSWASFYQDYYRGILPVPYDTILVELEEGPLMISNPDGFAESEIELGMPVTVRFLPCEDDAGAFELPVFARA